ncbi:MAG TPA: translocation/assembly module TamB domain-containing protein [Bacteroidia bacterium]|nr:translocation/assembly module TamB domain-containing protein [Bacteroidia bacterium]
MSDKSIKIGTRVLLYIMAMLFVLLLGVYVVFRSSFIQTWLTKRVASYFSSQWNTEVSVGGIDIELFKKIVLEGVYVEDMHQDTLLYVEKLKLDIGIFNTEDEKLLLDNVLLKNANIKLKKYEGEDFFNYQFILDAFKSTDTTRSDNTSKWDVAAGGFELENVRFLYQTHPDTAQLSHTINFSDLSVYSLNGKLSDIKLGADTINLNVISLSFIEKSGFILKDLSSTISISSKELQANSLKAFTNQSQLNANLVFKYDEYDDFNDFIDKVSMKASFNKSIIQMADVAYFSNELYGMNIKTILTGDVSGKVGDLKGKNVFLNIENETIYKGNIDLIGLPDIEKTYMSFDVKELRTSKKGIEQIPLPPFNEHRFIALPSNISLFGTIKFKGNFSGFYYDFVSYGKFSTALGQIATDISLKQDSSNTVRYKGKFITQNFNLGRFFESEKHLGVINMNVNINGKDFSKQNAHLFIQGDVSSVEAASYKYQNINLNGEFARNIFNGKILVNDDNLNMDFSGSMDFSKSPTMIDFNALVSKAQLSQLHLVNDSLAMNITGKIQASIIGNGLNDAVGVVHLNNVLCEKDKKAYRFGDISLSSNNKQDVKTIVLSSSIADAKVSGRFLPLHVGQSFLEFLHNYFPVQVPLNLNGKKPKKKVQNDEFAFSLIIKNADPVTKVFFPSIEIANNASCAGEYNSLNSLFKLNASLSFFSAFKYKLSNLNLSSDSKNDQLNFQLLCDRLNFADSVWIDNLSLNLQGKNDTIDFETHWKNSTQQNYTGDVSGIVALSEKSKTKINFSPSTITIADSTWRLQNNNEIIIDSTGIDIKNIDFVSTNQQIKVFGKAADDKESKLNLVLSSFSLNNFNSALKGTGVAMFGTVSGSTTVSSVYKSPLLLSELTFKDLRINKELIGSGNVSSNYDSYNEVLNFNGNFIRDDNGDIKFNGNYSPFKHENSLQASLLVNSINLAFFEPFVKNFVENLKGTAGANLKVTGTPDKPIVTGIIRTDVENVHVNYLGTDYNFNATVNIEPNAFDFADLTIYDVNKNTAQVVNGKIFHSNYKNFQMDIDIQANKCMMLNTTEKDNSLFYGKCYGSGIINIFGFLDHINLSAALKTERIRNSLGKNEYSQLFIPLSETGSASENGFVTFVNKSAVSTTIKPSKYNINTTGFTMDLKIEPTVDAQMQLIFDEKVGDILKGTGTGNIEMTINEFGDFKMYGDYMIEEGDYLFTLKNIVNKKFRLEKGGTVKWAGNPEQALINVNAIYELRTSLSPLFLDHEQTDATRKRYPVDLVMNLTGKLMQPDILFDVKLPTTDDFTRQKAYEKFKNSENDLNKEVFSLLVMNSFVPPDPSKSQQQPTTTPGAGTVTSTEMLSNQLSNWLSQISNEFDVGVHYRPGDYINRDQLELALSTQLFNDKLSIDGTVANNSNVTSQNTSNIVGDINAEYKLTEDGKLRAKAYNKTNEGNILNTQKGPYTQGLGVFYREEFDTIGELYRRFLLKKKKNKS